MVLNAVLNNVLTLTLNKTHPFMRIIFMGTPEFAVHSLDILLKNGYNIVAVVTSVDSFGGRGGKQLLESAVKKHAQLNNISILQPKNLKSPIFLEELKAFQADLQIVVAFRMLPEVVWNLPAKGTFNLHGSLLPRYRGAAPINHAIINGDKITGVTSFKLKHEIDTGDTLIQRELKIDDDDTAGSLHDKMMHLGAEVILETVQLIEKGSLKFISQDESKVSKAPKIFHEICEIDFLQSIETVYNFIRGLSPYPGAWFRMEGKEFKVFSVEKKYISDATAPKTIKTDHKKTLSIKCIDGYIGILEFKPEGKRKMPVTEYLNGNQISVDIID